MFTNYIYSMLKLIKYSLYLILINFLVAHECLILNDGDYGNCDSILGYTWNGNGCSETVSGCSYYNQTTGQDDSASFYPSYEQCISNCFQHTGVVGDLNEDFEIDILDIVIIINVIIGNIDPNNHEIWASDINGDFSTDVLDVVTIVNIVINGGLEERSTFEIISDEIFVPYCSGCHYEGSFYAEQSGLIMTEDVLYSEIINTIPTNTAAANDGLVLISNEGGIAATQLSYLWEKINIWEQEHYFGDHPNYGELMPLGGPYLNNGQLAFVEKWILEGAPQQGVVANPNLLSDQTEYEPPAFIALQEPEQGFQFHLGPFEVEPGGEREFFYYEPNIADEDLFIKRVEISMRPGSHHFIFYTFDNSVPNFIIPEPQVYRDLYDENGEVVIPTLLAMGYHQFVSGTQWPFMDYYFPDNIALRLPSDFGLDLNGHYFNYTNSSITGEIYANIHTVNEEDVEHVAEILMLNNTDIYIPPNEETIIEKVFSFEEIKQSNNIPNNIDNIFVFQLLSHAHQLMERFDIDFYDAETGTIETIYTALDYLHPPIITYNDHLEINAGDYLRLRTTYNNTTDEPVEFGLLSINEMMIVFGYFYY